MGVFCYLILLDLPSSLLLPSYHLGFLLSIPTSSFRLEDFSDHFPSSSTNKLEGKSPLTPVGTRAGICPKLRYEHPAHTAVLLPCQPRRHLGKAFWCRFHTCWSWHWKTEFMLSPDKKPHRMFFCVRRTCRKVKISFLVSYAKQKQPPGTIRTDWKLKWC